MLFNAKAMLVATLALIFTGQVMGEAQIATNPGMLPPRLLHLLPLFIIGLAGTFLMIIVAACNCPNNCSYKAGHSCKFYAGPSDHSPVLSGSK